MIDASAFASKHNAFWTLYAPTSEHFVRRLNLEFCERFCVPMVKQDIEVRRALVAELGFSLFVEQERLKLLEPRRAMTEENFNLAWADTQRVLRPLMSAPYDIGSGLTETEKIEVTDIQMRLEHFFQSRKRTIKSRPQFLGCGYVDMSEGDIISDKTLFEIKTVDRTFRSIDIRQLISYCALNHVSGQYDIKNLGLFNPRRGTFVEYEIDDVTLEISGRSSQDLFDIIVEAISSGDISR